MTQATCNPAKAVDGREVTIHFIIRTRDGILDIVVRNVIFIAIVACAISGLYSCQDAGSLLPQLSSRSTQSETFVKTIAPGSFVHAGESIPLALVRSSDNKVGSVLQVEITSTAQDLSPLAKTRFSLGGTAPGPFQLPSTTTPGVYDLVVTLMDDGGQKNRQSTPFYCIVGDYSIRSLSSTPTMTTVGSVAFLNAELALPQGANPWLRWSIDGETIAEGPLSDALVHPKISLPEERGVYVYRLDLFPFQPSAAAAGLDSPEFKLFRTSIDQLPAVTDSNIGASDDFALLFPLQGHLSNQGWSGSLDPKLSLIPLGAESAFLADGLIGYRLGNGKALTLAASVLPDTASNFAPLTYAMELACPPIPQDASGESVLFESKSGDRWVRLSLGLDSSLVLAFHDGTFGEARVKAEKVDLGSPGLVQAKVSRVGEAIVISLFRNDVKLGDASLAHAVALGDVAPFAVTEGSTSLGSADGSSVVFYSFGVHRAKNPLLSESEKFVAMQYRFNTANSSDHALDSRVLRATGDVRASDQGLLLSTGSSLELGVKGLDSLTLDFANSRADLAGKALGTDVTMLSIYAGADRNPTLRISADGRLLADDGKVLDAHGITPIRLELGGQTPGVYLPDVATAIAGIEAGTSLRVEVSAEAPAYALLVPKWNK